jgi:hypothetical protein
MKYLLWTLVLTVPWMAGSGYVYHTFADNKACRYDFVMTYLYLDGRSAESDGVFTFDNRPFGDNSGGYVGAISYRSAQGKLDKSTPVHLSFTYTYQLSKAIAVTRILDVSRELGDASQDSEISQFLSPALQPGKTNRTQLVWVQGTRLATGIQYYPRMICSTHT